MQKLIFIGSGMPTIVCGKSSLFMVQHLMDVITFWMLSAVKQANSLLTVGYYQKRQIYNKTWHNNHPYITLLYWNAGSTYKTFTVTLFRVPACPLYVKLSNRQTVNQYVMQRNFYVLMRYFILEKKIFNKLILIMRYGMVFR